MLNIADKRVQREIAILKKDKVQGILGVEMLENNPRYHKLTIEGPDGTPYAKGIYHLEIYYTDNYPQSPPKVRFLNKIYHPNIDGIGRICLDILKDKWTPILQIKTIALSLISLLQSPNLDDPLDQKVAEHFKKDGKGATEKAIEYVKKYASK